MNDPKKTPRPRGGDGAAHADSRPGPRRDAPAGLPVIAALGAQPAEPGKHVLALDGRFSTFQDGDATSRALTELVAAHADDRYHVLVVYHCTICALRGRVGAAMRGCVGVFFHFPDGADEFVLGYYPCVRTRGAVRACLTACSNSGPDGPDLDAFPPEWWEDDFQVLMAMNPDQLTPERANLLTVTAAEFFTARLEAGRA